MTKEYSGDDLMMGEFVFTDGADEADGGGFYSVLTPWLGEIAPKPL